MFEYQLNYDLSEEDNFHILKETIDKVCLTFDELFGGSLLSRYPLYIDNCFNYEGKSKCGYTPIINKVLNRMVVIKLGIDDFTKMEKIVYQLAHELTHYVFYSIKGLDKEKADFLEESICSAMSLLIIKKYYTTEIFNGWCEHVKKLKIEHYKEGYVVAESCEFNIDNLVNKILNM